MQWNVVNDMSWTASLANLMVLGGLILIGLAMLVMLLVYVTFDDDDP